MIPISRPILRTSLDAFDDRNAGAFLGSLAATLLLFAPSLLALGMVAPAAIRLRMSSVEDAGKAAGFALRDFDRRLNPRLASFL